MYASSPDPQRAGERPHADAALPSPQRPPDVHAEVLFDQVDTVYRVTREPLLAGLVAAFIIAALVWEQVPHALVAAWLVPKVAFVLMRLGLVRRYHRDVRARDRVRRWAGLYLVLLVLETTVWAAMPLLFMPYCDPAIDTALFGAALGVAAVGVYTISHHFVTGMSFLATMLGPLIVDQALNYGRVGLYSAAGVTVYLVVLTFEARRGEQRIRETLRLRYENAWIAEQRARALALAEHSSAAKTRFLAAVSHEIRTPLNGIFGMTQLLRGTVPGEREQQQLQVVERSARHLRTVIGDLLDMSRIEFGRLVIEDEPFVVKDTIREVTDLLSPVAAEKGLAFAVTFAPDLPLRVRGDAGRVKQVLHNLVGNAIKFTPGDGRGAVNVHAAACPGGLRLAVTDNGEGMHPHQISRIFDPFEQVGADVAARRAGTGLGLTISRELARAMGGDVTCSSRPGEGTQFVLQIAAPAVMERAAAEQPHGVAPHALPWISGRVLVVDDNPVNALVASTMLERVGLVAEQAPDGEQALELLARGHYDLVLMDCLMPGIDGLEATRRWRQAEARDGCHRIPIVALTASAVAGDRERCLAAGMDDHLTKPFEQADLVALLERYLGGGNRPAGGTAPAGAARLAA